LVETRWFDYVHKTLVHVGEEQAVIHPPEILDQLENLLRRCLDQGTTRRQLFDVTAKVAFDGIS
jgi:hypothetical protein